MPGSKLVGSTKHKRDTMSGQLRGNNLHIVMLDRNAPLDQIIDDINLALSEHKLMFLVIDGGPNCEFKSFELVKVGK